MVDIIWLVKLGKVKIKNNNNNNNNNNTLNICLTLSK